MIITIDGPAGAGKGTICKSISEKFNLTHVDTGLYYRAIGFFFKDFENTEENIIKVVDFIETLDVDSFDINKLRLEETAKNASKIATVKEIRSSVTKKIRNDVSLISDKGAIVDGRDAGSVIFPQARCKLFITASNEERAKRRLMELGGEKAERKDEICERDARDEKRKSSPLRPAENAFIIDTTNLTIDEACFNAACYIDEFI